MNNFNEKIYEKLKLVPRGKIITYKELAKAINSRAYRAVGGAMKNNKEPNKIPCYKVVLSDGSVGNYSSPGGAKEKIRRLQKDGIEVVNNKVDLKRYLFRFE